MSATPLVTFGLHNILVKTVLRCQKNPFYTSRKHKNRRVSGLRPDPLGELTALPQTSQLDFMGRPLRGHGKERKAEDRGEERKGKGESIRPPSFFGKSNTGFNYHPCHCVATLDKLIAWHCFTPPIR